VLKEPRGTQRLLAHQARLYGIAGARQFEEIGDQWGALVEKSLLQRESAPGGELRFGMLETVREYAGEQLAAHGELEAVQQRHAAYYGALARQAAAELTGPEQGAWLDLLQAEHANLRAVLHRARERREVAMGLGLGSALWRFLLTRGYLAEGRAWLEGFLAQAQPMALPSDLRAPALFAAGALAYDLAEHQGALSHWEQALALYGARDDRAGVAMALNGLRLLLTELGSYERARSLLEESVALHRALGDTENISRPLTNLANLLRYQGDNQQAQQLYEDCLAVDRARGARQCEATTLDNLAQIAEATGAYERAEVLGRACLALMRDLGDSFGTGHALITLGCGAQRAAGLSGVTARPGGLSRRRGEPWRTTGQAVASAPMGYRWDRDGLAPPGRRLGPRRPRGQGVALGSSYHPWDRGGCAPRGR
jgi:tetratricopeptide (TPR) repeat protein